MQSKSARFFDYLRRKTTMNRVLDIDGKVVGTMPEFARPSR